MLELMISKPQASHAMLQDGFERQTLPSRAGFADMLKSNLSTEFRKQLSRDDGVDAERLTEGESQGSASILSMMLGDESMMAEGSLMNPESDSMMTSLVTSLESGVNVTSTTDINMLEATVDTENATQAGLLEASAAASQMLLNEQSIDPTLTDADLQTSEAITGSVLSENASQTDGLSVQTVSLNAQSTAIDELTEAETLLATESGLGEEIASVLNQTTVAEDAHESEEDTLITNAELSGLMPETDTLGLNVMASKTVGSSDSVVSESQNELTAEAVAEIDSTLLDEELVLGAGMSVSEQVIERGLAGSNGERLGDRTSELRQEARTVKMAQAAEQAAQNSASGSKGFSDSSQGQQNRDQGSQQQQMNSVQPVVQNAQTVRDQQLAQQFSSALGERISSQASSADERLNLISGVTERRAQLPVGLQSIGLPVSHQKWGQAMGQRVVYMANQQMQQAQITLNPEKLGPVQVRLHIDRDQQVHVMMTAQHGVTREAMDAAIPRLREMFEQSGMNLGSVDVNDQNQFAEGERNETDDEHSAANHNEKIDEELVAEASNTTTYETDNVVDYYA